MEVKKLKRLVQCLELMASDQDGEALSAARMASKIVKEHKLSWGDIVRVVIDQPKPVAPTVHAAAPQPQRQHQGQQHGFQSHPQNEWDDIHRQNQQEHQAWQQNQYSAYQQQAHQQHEDMLGRMYRDAVNKASYNPQPKPKEEPPITTAFDDFTEKSKKKRSIFGGMFN